VGQRTVGKQQVGVDKVRVLFTGSIVWRGIGWIGMAGEDDGEKRCRKGGQNEEDNRTVEKTHGRQTVRRSEAKK